MKIIDILNKIADGTLEDGFEFIYDYIKWIYNKDNKIIERIDYNDDDSIEYITDFSIFKRYNLSILDREVIEVLK